MKRTIIAAALTLLLIAPVAAQDFDKGFAAANRGDYATALREWRPLAEQGHLRAQYNLGVMNANGQGVPQDYAEAYIWFSLAATGGHTDAPKVRDFLPHILTPDQLRDAQREAKRRWDRIQARKK